jgi:RecA-family ATPase
MTRPVRDMQNQLSDDDPLDFYNVLGDELANYGVDVDGDGREDDDERHDERPADGLAERAYTSSEVCNLPPLESLVDGLLLLPGESVLYSPPKLAKSFWALDLSFSVGSGQHFMGREVRQGPVAYVAAEGVGGLGARVQAWHDYHGRASNYVDDVTFIVVAINLMDSKAVRQLCDYLKALGVILTVIDTLARCTAGAEENSARDMGQVVEAIDQIRDATGGHVLIVHHSGKDTTRGMRGSSALLGAVDTTIELSGDRSSHSRARPRRCPRGSSSCEDSSR